jgi:transcriptional regulator with XRE-family HTH domain
MPTNPIVTSLLSSFHDIRQAAGLTPEQLDERLIFGPGWVRRFETGDTVPSIDVLVVMLAALNSDLRQLIDGANLDVALEEPSSAIDRMLSTEQFEDDALLVRFRYADYDATYQLPNASLQQFDEVLRTLRDGLAQIISSNDEEQRSIKTNAVAASFLRAVELWPHANPSDLWWFVISRAYLDPFNHPARYARLDHGQSWKRAGGWALEEVLVHHYSPALLEHRIGIFIAYGEEKQRFLGHLETDDRLEADKADVLLVGITDTGPMCFGVVHVKASFAERRTDDVPMSKALVEAGYCSPLWTMDCKSVPSAQPFNRGELGPARQMVGPDRRSAKRKDIEDDGYFSACFSYNRNTVPTPAEQDATGRIVNCDFTNPSDDAFVRFIREEWDRFQSKRTAS